MLLGALPGLLGADPSAQGSASGSAVASRRGPSDPGAAGAGSERPAAGGESGAGGSDSSTGSSGPAARVRTWVAANLPQLEALTLALGPQLGAASPQHLHAAISGCASLRWVNVQR